MCLFFYVIYRPFQGVQPQAIPQKFPIFQTPNELTHLNINKMIETFGILDVDVGHRNHTKHPEIIFLSRTDQN